MDKEYEVKSEEVLNVLEKYREKLKIESYQMCFQDTYDKKYYLRINFKSDFEKFDFERVPEGSIEVHFSKERNILKLGNDGYGSNYLVFKDLNKLKDIVSMLDELQKINYLELDEFKGYVALKEKKKKIEEEKKKLEEQLKNQQQELENKLKELEENIEGEE